MRQNTFIKVYIYIIYGLCEVATKTYKSEKFEQDDSDYYISVHTRTIFVNKNAITFTITYTYIIIIHIYILFSMSQNHTSTH